MDDPSTGCPFIADYEIREALPEIRLELPIGDIEDTCFQASSSHPFIDPTQLLANAKHFPPLLYSWKVFFSFITIVYEAAGKYHRAKHTQCYVLTSLLVDCGDSVAEPVTGNRVVTCDKWHVDRRLT